MFVIFILRNKEDCKRKNRDATGLTVTQRLCTDDFERRNSNGYGMYVSSSTFVRPVDQEMHNTCPKGIV
jgi:hypothetical protein